MLDIVAGRWRVLILRELFRSDVLRFGELRKGLDGISDRILTQELRALEAAEVIVRRIYDEVPPKVEYRLTDKGRTLEPILRSMSEWAVAHIPLPTQV